jgi:hypothetical protein
MGHRHAARRTPPPSLPAHVDRGDRRVGRELLHDLPRLHVPDVEPVGVLLRRDDERVRVDPRDVADALGGAGQLQRRRVGALEVVDAQQLLHAWGCFL